MLIDNKETQLISELKSNVQISYKQNPLLSIIIPTKDRYKTLIPVVEAILKYVKDDRFELIIQDNSTNNSEVFCYFNNHEDNRLRYYYTQDELSISENTVLAIEKTNGKYVIFIGDDDLVSPHICEIVAILDENHIDCLIYDPAYYWWDSVSFVKENYYNRKNAFWLANNTSPTLVKRNAHDELIYALNKGASLYYHLPRFYHGIVKKNVLYKIKNKTGSFLSGSCPDMAFAIGISLIIEDYYYINYPVSVFGASSNSGGGWTAEKKHFGKIEDQKFLPKDILKKWDPLIPEIWSQKSIYAQTTSEVLKAFKSDLKLNYVSFYATMIAYEPYLMAYIKPKIMLYCKHNLKPYLNLFFIYIKRILGICFKELRISTKTYGKKVYILDSLDKVMEILNTMKVNSALIKKIYD